MASVNPSLSLFFAKKNGGKMPRLLNEEFQIYFKSRYVGSGTCHQLIISELAISVTKKWSLSLRNKLGAGLGATKRGKMARNFL
jgi:hypothetical protein